MNLNQIELLRVLQETDFSLSKAAIKMHVVQSAVSRQLQLFEAELGAPLFERQGKKLTRMTPLGMRILNEISVIHRAKNNIKAIAADYLDSDKGTLHIATTHTQAKYFLPVPIQRFREKYPKIKIYMVQASPEQLITQLHNGKADIAICTEKVDQDNRLVVEKCYQWHHAIVVPTGHALCTEELSLERLASFPILTYNLGFTGRSMIEQAFENAGLSLDVTLAATDTDVIKTYVRLKMGVGLITSMAYHPTVDNDLVMRDLAQFIPSASTKIAYLKNNYLPLYVQHFIEEIRSFGEELNA